MLVGAFLFTSNVFAETSGDSSNSEDAKKGELIVSIETDSQDKDTLNSMDNDMLSSKSLNQQGFDISDSLVNSIQTKTTTMSDHFQANIDSQMGLASTV